MPLADAMRFVAAVRTNPAILRDITSLEQCRVLGAKMGLDFSVVELRDAHGKEWGMRHFHFAKRIAR
jgi:hypothetical protein